MRRFLAVLLMVGLLASQSCGDDSGQNDQNADRADGKSGAHRHNWSYNVDREQYGPEQWQNLYPVDGWCDVNKRRQSPINIELEHVKTNTDLAELYTEVENEDGKTTLKNNGHAAVVSVAEQNAFLNGGALKNRHRIQQFHFHWGSDASKGSEHEVNSKAFPLEMHFVTYNSEEYDTILAAAGSGQGDALAVVGTFFEISEEDNPAFQPIISHLSEVIEPGQGEIEIEGVEISDILPKNLNRYYTYPGSLTTPNCYETVMWYVLNQTQTISANQMSQFRAMHEGRAEDGTEINLVNNYRPVQPLYGRVIQSSFNLLQPQVVSYRSMDGPGGGASSIISSASLIISLISCVFLFYLKH